MGEQAVIVSAGIAAGHGGAAELVLSVRYENGVVSPVVLNPETAIALMNACGVADIDKLAGHAWRKVLEEA
jgi:hypothetical protein